MNELNKELRYTSLMELDAAISKGMRNMGFDGYEAVTLRIAKVAFEELKPLISGIGASADAAVPHYAIAEGVDMKALTVNVNKMLEQGYRLTDSSPFTFERQTARGSEILLGREMLK